MKSYHKHIAQTLLLNVSFDRIRHISVPLAENLIKNQFKMLFSAASFKVVESIGSIGDHQFVNYRARN